MTEMTRCLGQLSNHMESLTEARLHQLTFEAFMLAEESFRMRAHDNNAKAMTLCSQQDSQVPEHVYAQLLVSHTRHDSYAYFILC